ncbi:MAG: NAD-dependent epimerase/dehydratase family protein [Acidobacteriota bacterium]|nr:NAD-dependent epimerase/dehydratase family protein [Blastocatellia bacterium]MDW8241357.1 NAD-dependent epimerase/dehydratase family protein [Acidobacteriota bacterium]
MRYFVTGATGFIGGVLVRQLVESGHDVVALVRAPQRAAHLAALGIKLVTGDITDKASMRAAMTGVDGVFHLAAWYQVGVRDRSLAEQINVQGTRNVLQLMQELGINKGVYTSTIAVFSDTRGRLVDESYRYEGPHLSEYDRTKWLAHYQVAEPMIRAGLPLVIVQPSVVYGPGDNSAMAKTFKLYLRRRLPMLPRGTMFCWAHVEDVARGHLLAMEKGQPGQSYILSGPPHTMIEVFQLAEKITGVRAPRLHVSPAMLRLMSKLMEPISYVLPLPTIYHPESLRVAAGVTYIASNEKAQRELGFTVRPLEQGLRDTLSVLMQQLHPA